MTVAAPDILALTRDARLAPHAMSAIPAWLWSADGSRVLWANASGAVALNAPSVAALTERIFTSDEPLGADIARLAETLPPTSQKYERLRDIGSSLVCACARVEIGGVAGILVTASEPAAQGAAACRARRIVVRREQRTSGGVLGRRCVALHEQRTRIRNHAGELSAWTPSGSAAAATRCCSRCCRMKGRKLAPSRRPSSRKNSKLARRRCHPRRASRSRPRRASPRSNPRLRPSPRKRPHLRPRISPTKSPLPPSVRCASCGPWTRTSASISRRRPSPKRWGRAPPRRSASRGARSQPSSASMPKAASQTRSRRATPSAASCSRGPVRAAR